MVVVIPIFVSNGVGEGNTFLEMGGAVPFLLMLSLLLLLLDIFYLLITEFLFAMMLWVCKFMKLLS